MIEHILLVKDIQGADGHQKEMSRILDEASSDGFSLHSWSVTPCILSNYVVQDNPPVRVLEPTKLYMVLVRPKADSVKSARAFIGGSDAQGIRMKS